MRTQLPACCETTRVSQCCVQRAGRTDDRENARRSVLFLRRVVSKDAAYRTASFEDLVLMHEVLRRVFLLRRMQLSRKKA